MTDMDRLMDDAVSQRPGQLEIKTVTKPLTLAQLECNRYEAWLASASLRYLGQARRRYFPDFDLSINVLRVRLGTRRY